MSQSRGRSRSRSPFQNRSRSASGKSPFVKSKVGGDDDDEGPWDPLESETLITGRKLEDADDEIASMFPTKDTKRDLVDRDFSSYVTGTLLKGLPMLLSLVLLMTAKCKGFRRRVISNEKYHFKM